MTTTLDAVRRKAMRFVSLFLFLNFFVGFVPLPAAAADSLVRFSEIAWMGTALSAADEWIELENTDGVNVDLNGWQIVSVTDGKPNISLGGTIAGGGFFLIERTNDDTVPNVTADIIASFGSGSGVGLSNTGETLELRDSSGLVVDTATWTAEGPGDKTTKTTMMRSASGAWVTSSEPGGTPRSVNGAATLEPEPSPPPPSPAATSGFSDELPPEDIESPPDDAPINGPQADDISGGDATLVEAPDEDASVGAASADILISELLPDPKGDDGKEEFVELYNSGPDTVNLSEWSLRDASGRTKELVGEIAAGAYLVFFAEDGMVPSLNNSGDVIELLTPSGVRREGISYSKAPKGSALALTTSGWSWTTTPTPGTANTVTNQYREGSETGSFSVAPSGPDKSPPVLPPPSAPAPVAQSELLDGSDLAAALRTSNAAPANTPKKPWPLSLGLLFGISVGVVVFILRRVRREDEPVVEFAVEETESSE